ncbi:hydrogenase maturation protein [Aestuariirhabdus sp. Z084]|uniref:hydrogenase maturation protein n=1 Tax=Aestuariirhabdus haliotis TaxID=2918751 RepID=UPI00201B35DD|nr:hydrogenase maturation protein [Aestuariirhabdus haliotis]MCL6415161.1 hydrogenase maturation protein [Aestuariirhabdus haliotis]MCL6420036.1 hydrogenase maturation protein [Aestuariirhabdus haliotis]
MRILMLTHAFNSLSQRLFVELEAWGHEVSIEFDINDAVTAEAVEQFLPDLVLAPFLKRAIPESIWSNHLCLIIHPGVRGDRGATSLDWAITNNEPRWGVTCLQANAEMDAGDIWSWSEFPMRGARKSSLYRNEVSEAAVIAVRQALQSIQDKVPPQPLDYGQAEIQGQWRDPIRQAQRAINWQQDSTETVLRKLWAADSQPGVLDNLRRRECHLFNGWQESVLSGPAGDLIARRDGAICRATRDGAVWITHLALAHPDEGEATFKLPASQVLSGLIDDVPEIPLLPHTPTESPTWQEISYRESNHVGYLQFHFYNGAASSDQCRRLLSAWRYAQSRPVSVIVLLGGEDFWCNGIDLNSIEAAASPADASWENINAMNDLCEAIIRCDDKLCIAAMRGNAGAGGVFLALAADQVYARRSVVMNPHYKSMGNLYGSEYWTYLLPARVGDQQAEAIMSNRLPVSAGQAKALGLLDDTFGDCQESFEQEVIRRAESLARSSDYDALVDDKRQRREEDEKHQSLASYRQQELERMRLNFYGFDPSYHVARYHFVEKIPKSRTPPFLARHRRLRSTTTVSVSARANSDGFK